MQHLANGTLLQGGKYRIEKVLGQGGFGITYLVVQELLNRKVCIKEFFLKDLCSRTSKNEVILGTNDNADLVKQFLAKFIKEARMIAKLKNPNIIQIIDVFKENNTAYYVMEYIDGSSLEFIVDSNGALSENQAFNYIKQVANALDYLHKNNINHLDVKPANIMVTKSENKAVLIDFGISKQYDEMGVQTSTTPIGISYGYAPLEQYKPGGISEFSPQSDIYSLGATLYKLVTGKTPPQAIDLLNGDLLVLPENISDNIRSIITQTMKIRKQERPEKITDLTSLFNDKKINNNIIHEDEMPANYELAESFFNKGLDYLKKEDYNNAINFIQKASDLGHKRASLLIGHAYKYGTWGLEKNGELAFNWFKRASKFGERDALENLAECYDEGIGTEVDKIKAFELYNQCFNRYIKDAERGDEEAIRNVIFYYENELGITYNPSKVFVWTEKLANTNEPWVLAKLSVYYEIGLGTEINLEKSKEYYTKTIKISDAERLLGIGYDFATSNISQVREHANKWIQLAFDKEEELSADFLEEMGFNFEVFSLTENHLDIALKCYELAAQKGSTNVFEQIGYLKDELNENNDVSTKLIIN